jgi:DDE superfamily endonuclease
MATAERGLKKGLSGRSRTVFLMLDETIITETPPLYNAYGKKGLRIEVPISGNRAKRVLHGVINIRSGETHFLIADAWNQQTHQVFMRMIRRHWRGWYVVIFLDKGSPHTADESRLLAKELGLELKFLPTATPELNAMDHLWRFVKGQALANRKTQSIDRSADQAAQYLLNMSAHERLKKAGTLSTNFWLKNLIVK